MSSWITVPRLPDAFFKAKQRRAEALKAATAARNAQLAKQEVKQATKQTAKATPYYKGAIAAGPAGFLQDQAINQAEEHQSPQSFDELSKLIYGK